MRVAKIERAGRSAWGVVIGESVLVAGTWSGERITPARWRLPGLGVAEIEQLLHHSSETVALSDITLLPPIDAASRMICLGLNYPTHVAEIDGAMPSHPGLFIKLEETMVGQAGDIIRPVASEQFDFEGEIAVVIGRPGRHIQKEDALAHVFGYTIMLDGSIRDYQNHSVSAGKNFWRSSALGPWIVSADEIRTPSNMLLETRLNGVVVQSATADQMIYDVPTAIAYISQWLPLAPGDIIATGTPAGVGLMRKPPLWMKHGDRIDITVASIGTLTNRVQDETP